MNSEKSAELFETIGDPIAGALWSGPPFESRIWRSVIANRNPGSPAWLPQFRDGRFVRFMNQNGPTVPVDAPWGPMRIVYLQYASDAITFFAYRDAYRAPAWMSAPRGPDVSPELHWYPIVTMLQLALDMAVANGTPMGFGHVYAPEHYVDAWVAVTDTGQSVIGPPTRWRGLKSSLRRRRGRRVRATQGTILTTIAAVKSLLRHLDLRGDGGAGQRPLFHHDQAEGGAGHQRRRGAENVAERVAHVVGRDCDAPRDVMLAGERNVGTERDEQDGRERRDRERGHQRAEEVQCAGDGAHLWTRDRILHRDHADRKGGAEAKRKRSQ
ncbi:hypothetical protein ACVWWK_006878 [Bradyrhizobium sp. LB9.1b]